MKYPITVISTALCLASPAAAIDACMIGTWDANLEDLAHVLGAQLNGSAAIVSGRASMQILPDGDTTTLVDDVIFRVQMPDVPEMDVKVVGFSNGVMDTADGAWVLTVGTYDLVGSADVLGQTMTIPFTSATGMFGGGIGEYGCSSGSLSFESTGETPRIPRQWSR